MNLTAEEKRLQGKALSLREFAQAGGISYSLAIALSKEPGFPIFHGKIWWEDFVIWRRRAIQYFPHRCMHEDHPPDADRTANESVPKSDLQASLPPRAARLLAEVG
jgi:hypothetical protein